MRILVVEDEESLRITLAANLELEGYEVLEARDGKEAVALLTSQKIDLVLSDIRMPNMTGVDLLTHVKRHHPDVPMLLMTAYAVEDQIRKAVAEGVFTVLKKPFDFDGAVQSIVRALEHPCVLVVDDQTADAATIAESLRACGVRAKAVPSGETAVAEVRAGGVDVCVATLMTPGAGGADLVQRFREVAPGVTIIVCSAQNVREAIQRISAAGIFACLQKPVNPAELLQVVAKARGGTWAL